MFESIIKLLKEISFLVGYVKSSNFKETLSKDEEDKYINLLDSEDRLYAREKLITHNLRLVAHIVKKYDNCGLLNDDLISVGSIGLIKAIDSYSKEKATKLSSYISRCVENEILMHIRVNKKVISTLSLSDNIGEDEQGQELKLEDIISTEQIDYDEKLDNENSIALLFKYLKVLDEDELKILTYRYGLNGSKEYTQKEIGKRLNISRSYVSRIEKKALGKLLFEFRKNQN